MDTRHTRRFGPSPRSGGPSTHYWKGPLACPTPNPASGSSSTTPSKAFATQMADFRVELDDAVAHLDRHYGELKQAARERLGSLFNPADYPETLVGLFGDGLGFPQRRAARLPRPALARSCTRPSGPGSRARFEEAVQARRTGLSG